MSPYFIGIDNGSQSSKVVIFDEEGKVHAQARQALRPNDTPRPGIVEHPGDDLWDSIGEASRRALADFAGDPAEIRGVGLCTIRFCRAMVREDGSLASPVLSWMDARVSRPYQDDGQGVAKVTTSSGYITRRMTGNNLDTAANYQGMWPIDTDTWQWLPDSEGFAACGYRRDQLFDLVMPGDQLGEVTAEAAAHTGIPAGTPVFATSNDKAVEALGSGLRGPGDVMVSLGTYIAAMSVGDRNLPGCAEYWTNFGCEALQYLYESDGIRRGMWTVSWMRDLVAEAYQGAADSAGVSLEQYLSDAAAEIPCGSDGLLVVLDWLAPTDEPFRKGAFVGFDGRQGRLHMYRAVLEAIAMTMATKVEGMAGGLGVTYDRLIVSGGGSEADLMMQIMADCFGIPTVRMRMNNAASLGAAMCAAVGTGTYASFDEAVAAMSHEGQTYQPIPANQRIYDALRPIQASLPAELAEVDRRIYEVVG